MTNSVVRSTRTALLRDLWEMCKPKVVLLMLITSVVGMALATEGWIPPLVLIFGNLGIAMVAASGAAINHLMDERIDQKMARTQRRPVATGRVSVPMGVAFAALLGAIGSLILWWSTNLLTMWLTLAALVGYAFIYTGFLKRATPQNIVIGGLAGAAPPLLGWTAVTGQIEPMALLLVLIIFTWTPPHFWALAIHRREDYAKANVPMLPVTHGVAYTKLFILLYTLLLTAVTLLPFLILEVGRLYLIAAMLLNLRFIQWAWRLYRDERHAMPTFRFSITYLLWLFTALLADHYLSLFAPHLARMVS
ncbi:protoheme IX farnesyltransferase [Natronospirillum operosum]|uniref:Protoheme IX farnesyltransferase n=1 Tax=Natronospirillum operosum TaxID=2759953 RepID=A0A4Z0W4A1_9GAMM|nr:heme o synthase [Natronospirillum operosum]TGG91522.1 protoheme IX farnesyltransferase [Natronospirillum operosum]